MASLKTGQRDTTADTHADEWGDGLRFGGKSLSVKTVGRARTPADALLVALCHNLRQRNADHRHRSRIDPARTPLNAVLIGPACPEAVAELAAGTLAALGITPPRCDTIIGIELVFQPPPGSDEAAFWRECLHWSGKRYECIVSAVVHRDQRRPHLHLIALALAGGKFAGNDMTSGPNRFVLQRRAFFAHVRAVLGLRPDRKTKTLTDLALSAGKGPKTAAAAARSDAALARRACAVSRSNSLGMGVDGHGGCASANGNPHAQAESLTPLLRTLSALDSAPKPLPDSLLSLWLQVSGSPRPSLPLPTPCPPPRSHAPAATRMGRLLAHRIPHGMQPGCAQARARPRWPAAAPLTP